MCSTTGPKIFGPPTGVVSGGTFAPPVNYASAAGPTADVGSTPAAPAPAPSQPPNPPTPQMPGPAQTGNESMLKRASANPFSFSMGRGGPVGPGRGPISRLYNS